MHQLPISINQILGLSTAASALLSILISALWAIYFNRIKEGQKAEFQKQIEAQKAEFSKQLEIIKAKNEKMNYITKTQFDAEFKMYQELSETCFLMFLDNSLLFPNCIDKLPDKEAEIEEYKNRYKRAKDSMLNYQNMLYKYAPFIKEDLYKLFDEFRKKGQFQINFYPDFHFPNSSVADCMNEMGKERLACFKRTSEMFKDHEKIIEELREYLQSLKVQED